MTEKTFKELITRVCLTFNRQEPKTARLTELWDDVSNIPDEAVADVIFMIKERDSMPMNLGKAIRDGWQTWKDSHPERLRPNEKADCPDQCSGGFLRVTGHINGRYSRDWFGFVAYCKRCNLVAWKHEQHAATRDELEAKGWIVERRPQPGPVKHRTRDEMREFMTKLKRGWRPGYYDNAGDEYINLDLSLNRHEVTKVDI